MRSFASCGLAFFFAQKTKIKHSKSLAHLCESDIITLQDNFTYKELDYENNSELGVGVKTFAAGSTTTIGKMKGHKLIYNIGMNLSNGKLGVNSYSIDTLDVTNEVHKWLADHGYTRTD